MLAHAELAKAIESRLAAVDFPKTQVTVEPWAEDASKIAVYFTAEAFSDLYPKQRFHWLIQALPDDFVQEHLSRSVWFELAPGESPEDLRYLDEEMIARIAPDVMRTLEGSGFFTALEDAMAPEDPTVEPERCHGDFRISKRILAAKGFRQHGEVDMISDAAHVLMSKGAYCDCEILFNVYQGSEMKAGLWEGLSEEIEQPEE